MRKFNVYKKNLIKTLSIKLLSFSILLGQSAQAFNPIELVELTTTRSMNIIQGSTNNYVTFPLINYSSCSVGSAYWEWNQTALWHFNADGKTPISYVPTLYFYNSSGISPINDGAGVVGNSWPWDDGDGYWHFRSSRLQTNWKVYNDSFVRLSFPAFNMGTTNTTAPYILSGKIRLGLACPSSIVLAPPSPPIFVSNVVDHVLGSYQLTYSADLSRATTPLTQMEFHELKGLVLKRYKVSYTITSANKLKTSIVQAFESSILRPLAPSTIVNFPKEQGLEDGTYQARIVQRDITFKDSIYKSRTFNINPIKSPTSASVLVNPDKSINIKWTAPSLTMDGMPIINSTWAGYHFYIYDSANALVYAFASSSINPGINNLKSPVLPLISGSYTMRIYPHLHNGSNGATSSILKFTLP